MSLITKAKWQIQLDSLRQPMSEAKEKRVVAKAAFIASKEAVVVLKGQILKCKQALKEDLDYPE